MKLKKTFWKILTAGLSSGRSLKITKNTTLLISIAARPGNMGTTLFNKAFAALNLDYLYKAMKLDAEGDLASVIKAIRALGVRGCSVSMPFKEKASPLMDHIDETAKKIGAINTIVNQNGVLTGYNTDYIGAREVLKKNFDLKGKACFVCGVGGVAKAVVLALIDLGAKVHVAGRNLKKTNRFADAMGVSRFSWEDRNSIKGELLINATPIGMVPDIQEMVVSKDVLKNFQAVFDVVANPFETALLKEAKKIGCRTVAGYQMAMEQSLMQFELYTGQPAPRAVMESCFLGEKDS